MVLSLSILPVWTWSDLPRVDTDCVAVCLCLVAGLHNIVQKNISKKSKIACSLHVRMPFSGWRMRLVPRYRLQKPPSRGRKGRADEGRSKGACTFRIHIPPGPGNCERKFGPWLHLPGASRGLQGAFKGASRELERGFTLKAASRGLEGASKRLFRVEGGFEEA